MPFLKIQFVHKNKVNILSLYIDIYIYTKWYYIQIGPKHKSILRGFLGVTSHADMYKHLNRIIQHSNLSQYYYSELEEKKIVMLEYKKHN